MNRQINIQLKYLLLLIAIICVLLYLQFTTPVKKDSVDIKTTKTITIKPKEDSATAKTNQPKEILVLVDDKGKFISKNVPKKGKSDIKGNENEIKNPVSDIKKDTSVTKAFQYNDTIKLKNGTIITDIISTGKILSQKYKLKTIDSIIENTTIKTITKYKVENVWFLSYEPKFTLFPTPAIMAHEISIDYTIKNKMRFGASIGINNLLPSNQQMYYGFKIGIRL